MTHVLECESCRQWTFYEKRRCAACGSRSFRKVDPGTGTLESVTEIQVTPSDVREPNAIGLASFDGASVIAQLEGELSVGDPVRLENGFELRGPAENPVRGNRLVSASSE